MLFTKRFVNKANKDLTEKIKRDLISTLQNKGINFARIEIGIRPGNLNIEVFL
jgi:hypothetical protein